MVEDRGHVTLWGLGTEPQGAFLPQLQNIYERFEPTHVLSLGILAYFAFYFIIYEFVLT